MVFILAVWTDGVDDKIKFFCWGKLVIRIKFWDDNYNRVVILFWKVDYWLMLKGTVCKKNDFSMLIISKTQSVFQSHVTISYQCTLLTILKMNIKGMPFSYIVNSFVFVWMNLPLLFQVGSATSVSLYENCSIAQDTNALTTGTPFWVQIHELPDKYFFNSLKRFTSFCGCQDRHWILECSG